MPKKKQRRAPGRVNLATRLAEMQEAWEKGEPRTTGAPIPDDNYAMRIDSAVVESAKSSGRMQVNFGLIVTEGDFADEERVLHKYAGMETDQNIDYLQGDLQTLELDIPPQIADIGDTIQDSIGSNVEVSVVTREGFTNFNFVELLQGEGEGEPPEPEKAGTGGEEEDYPTDAVIKKMSGDELKQLTKDWEIGVDPKKYRTVEALRKAVLKAS